MMVSRDQYIAQKIFPCNFHSFTNHYLTSAFTELTSNKSYVLKTWPRELATKNGMHFADSFPEVSVIVPVAKFF